MIYLMQIAKMFLEVLNPLIRNIMWFTHKAGLPQFLCSPNFEVGEHASMSLSVGPSLPHLSTYYKFCNVW